MRQNYNLKWSAGVDAFQVLQRFFNPTQDLDHMIQRIKEMVEKLPPLMGKIIKFGLVTGLRPAEAVESVRLLSVRDTEQLLLYYNPERQCLEHFRFPQFVRRTKKAYISFVTPEMIEPLASFGARVPSYNAIRLACRRRGIRCDFRYTRKIYASWLHKEGISETVIDFLQGRTSPSVFSRHYLTPDSSLRQRVLDSLDRLNQAISQ
jgi:intergrase/recombinase